MVVTSELSVSRRNLGGSGPDPSAEEGAVGLVTSHKPTRAVFCIKLGAGGDCDGPMEVEDIKTGSA